MADGETKAKEGYGRECNYKSEDGIRFKMTFFPLENGDFQIEFHRLDPEESCVPIRMSAVGMAVLSRFYTNYVLGVDEPVTAGTSKGELK